MAVTVARVYIYTQGNLNKKINKVENINFNNDVYKTEQLI